MYPAFGNNRGHIQWENKMVKAGSSLAKIIHPFAYVSPQAEIADGCVIMPSSVVNINTKIKKPAL